MEVYKTATEKKVSITAPVTAVNNSVDVYALDNFGTKIFDFQVVEFNDSEYSVEIPFHLLDNYATFSVRFIFDYIEAGVTYKLDKSVPIQVVTPFLTPEQVREVIGVSATDEEVEDAERAVRLVICSHTGQDFSRSIKTYRVKGNGTGSLNLPDRLIRLNKFNDFTYLPQPFYVHPTGRFISGGLSYPPSIKADFYGYHQINGVIYNPNNVNPSFFRDNQDYILTGLWGWDEVPEAVKAAAKLLLEDYSCEDSAYRDKYLEVVSAVDWRIQFSTEAFARTGNVRADQLLSPYTLRQGWGVL